MTRLYNNVSYVPRPDFAELTDSVWPVNSLWSRPPAASSSHRIANLDFPERREYLETRSRELDVYGMYAVLTNRRSGGRAAGNRTCMAGMEF